MISILTQRCRVGIPPGAKSIFRPFHLLLVDIDLFTYCVVLVGLVLVVIFIFDFCSFLSTFAVDGPYYDS